MRSRPALLLPLLGLILVGSVAATVSGLNEAGKAAYAKGDYTAAERLFSQALAQAPDEPLLHYHQGITLMRLSRWREASAAFESALRLNPPEDVAAAAREGIRSLGPLLRQPAARGPATEETTVTLQRIGGTWSASTTPGPPGSSSTPVPAPV
jgi:tetratricopeptide (TPR) repeat protein